MKTTPSLMEAPVVATPILDQFRKALTPSTGKEPTLEEKLSALSEADLKTVMLQSRIAHMSARMQRKVHGAPPETYGETISELIVMGIKYGNQIRMCWINNDANNDPPSYIVVGGCKP